MALQKDRHLIWDQIIVEANKFRPFIDFITDQENALTEAKKKVSTVLVEVQRIPAEIEKNVVDFLSVLLDDLANRYNIQNIFSIISWARRVIAKHRMLNTV